MKHNETIQSVFDFSFVAYLVRLVVRLNKTQQYQQARFCCSLFHFACEIIYWLSLVRILGESKNGERSQEIRTQIKQNPVSVRVCGVIDLTMHD